MHHGYGTQAARAESTDATRTNTERASWNAVACLLTADASGDAQANSETGTGAQAPRRSGCAQLIGDDSLRLLPRVCRPQTRRILGPGRIDYR
jgi:hypothetical protein